MTVHLFLGRNAKKRHLIYRYNSPFVSYYTTCAAWNFEKLKMLPVSFFSGVLRSLDLNSFDYKLKSGEQCSSDRKNDGTILPSSYLHRLEQTVIDEIIYDVWDVAFVPEADTEYRRFDFWAVDLTFDVVALSTFWQFFYTCVTERILKISLYFATIMTTSRLSFYVRGSAAVRLQVQHLFADERAVQYSGPIAGVWPVSATSQL